MSQPNKEVTISKGPELLTDGMYDHGCLIQRPRYFRHCLFLMCFVCAIFAIPIFFSAMSTIIVQKEELPLWSRYSEKYNTPTPDAAIFTNDIDGSIYVRLCRGDGRVPFFCRSCDSSSSSSVYDEYSKTDPKSENAPGKFPEGFSGRVFQKRFPNTFSGHVFLTRTPTWSLMTQA